MSGKTTMTGNELEGASLYLNAVEMDGVITRFEETEDGAEITIEDLDTALFGRARQGTGTTNVFIYLADGTKRAYQGAVHRNTLDRNTTLTIDEKGTSN